MKFLAFEQTFKNALTGLPLGSAKGGSDFNPKGKSDAEILRFCQSFILELHKFIGAETDIPAGDIGVGTREIGYMYKYYKKITLKINGSFSGKGLEFGGIIHRTESTGYGIVYFLEEMLTNDGEILKDKKILLSGSGNVALHTLKKLIELGAKPITLSDSNGYIYVEKGIDKKLFEDIINLKEINRGRLKELKGEGIKYYDKKTPWEVKGDIAIPCAIQNEIGKNDANNIVKNGIRYLIEGANMPLTKEAKDIILKNKIKFAPSKAANCGGVACSFFEMSQNSTGLSWKESKVESKLRDMMKSVFKNCQISSKTLNCPEDLSTGGYLFSFKKIEKSMISQGF